MAHKGRFTITTVANPDIQADISFKRESQLSPRAPVGDGLGASDKSLKPSFASHHLEVKPDTSPSSAQAVSFPQMRNGVKPVAQDTEYAPQRDTPVFAADQLGAHRRKESKNINSPYRSEQSFNAEDTRLVPMQLVTMLQESLCGKFTEMMQMHKEVMGEMALRDQRRDEQMSLLISQNIELVRAVTRLRCEQSALSSHRAPK